MSTDFGNRLKIVREEKGLKREVIAQKIGTSAAIIGRYERGERTPSVDIAKKIAEALDVSLDYLVGETSVLIKDKKMIYRLEIMQQISEDDRRTVLKVMDSLLKEMMHSSAAQRLMGT